MKADLSSAARDVLSKLAGGGKLFRIWWQHRPWFELDGQPLDPILGPQELMKEGLIENKPLTDEIYAHRIPLALTPSGEEAAKKSSG
jgi:hypothetical protein